MAGQLHARKMLGAREYSGVHVPTASAQQRKFCRAGGVAAGAKAVVVHWGLARRLGGGLTHAPSR